MKEGMYKNFISKENYLKKQKEKNKKEGSLILVIFVINIVMSFRFFKIFSENKEKVSAINTNGVIEYSKKESLVNCINVLNERVKEANINNGKGTVLINLRDVNEMLKKLAVEDIEINKERDEAKLRITEVRDDR
ncbi:hypothetical protein [Clostridium sp.]|uniref:hypothetical protein n=1 Tax=Clostridium sp. TaxID=1506 RepID=UPI003F3AD4F3